MGDLRCEMYPDIEPYDTGMLPVSDIHTLYYEQCGKKDGNPILVVHGGPGSGCSPRDRTFFDPEVYRIILLDQRGAGKSTPSAEIKENTTWHLVEDMESLRKHLNIEKWVLFGGSWGSTLALTYAETHPGRVKALILRGIFTFRRTEVVWIYQEGARFLFPDAWEKYIEPIPERERYDIIGAYYRRLTSEIEEERLSAAKSWCRWESFISRLYVDPQLLERAEQDTWSLQFARMECHYFVHGGFFETDSYILDNVDKIKHIPTTIVHGRYDVVCPVETAWLLHKRLPDAKFHIVPDAGHNNKEPGIQSLLVEACETYKYL